MRRIMTVMLCLLLAVSVTGCSLIEDVLGGGSSGEYIGDSGKRDKKDDPTAAPTAAVTAVPADTPAPTDAPEPVLVHDTGPCDSWTVLIYIDGADLESVNGMATLDILEMLTAPYDDNIHVILCTGGAAEWQNDVMDPGALEYWMVSEDDILLLESLPLANMGNPATLTAFIDYGVSHYPADRTALVLWDHGSGPIIGYGADENYDYDSMVLSELDQALMNAKLTEPLYFIGFDACLMATVEVAAAIAPYAEYMIASEELEPGTGWEYTHFLTSMVSNRSVSVEALFDNTVEGFLWNASQSESDDMCTLSLVDLYAIEPVTDALDVLASRITADLTQPDRVKQITKARAGSLIFGGSDPDEGIMDVVDLKDFAYKILPLYPQEGQALINALDDAIIATGSGRARMAATGLSVYFPFLDQEYRVYVSELYQDVPFSPVWKTFASDFVGVLEQREEEVPELSFDETTQNENIAAIQIDADIYDDVGYIFYSLALDLEDGTYLELGYDNDLYVDWATGYAEADFMGYWVCLNDNPVPFYIIEEAEYGNLYNIPALLNGEFVNIRCAWYWDPDGQGGSYKVLGAVRPLDKETRIVNRQMIPLEDGDVVTPVFTIVDGQGQFIEQFDSDPITIYGEPVLEDFDLISGTYLFGFRVLDWSMNLIGTEYFSIDWSLE